MEPFTVSADRMHADDSDAFCFYTADRASQLGRSVFHEDTKTLWCSFSGSGIAFDFSGSVCLLDLIADTAWKQENQAARYAVYVNDTCIEDALLTSPQHTVVIAHTGAPEQMMHVRLMKLSESLHSALGIRGIRIQNPPEHAFKAAPAKPKLIEFIGDSITCGYGVDGSCTDIFRTGTENITRSYAYLTAQDLGCDYSMVCFSGYGIISGYTVSQNKDTSQLLQPYYDRIGHSISFLADHRRIEDDFWQFDVQPDLIVVNLGTNDSAYTGDDPEKQQDFAAGYTAFLKQIRANNPAAKLLCVLGIMGQILCEAMEYAVSDYTTETGDTEIRTLRLAEQLPENGYGVDFHPSAVSHQIAAAELTAFIRSWLKW